MTSGTDKIIKEILVIDDDDVILKSIQRQLKGESLNLELVNDPIEGLNKIERKRYNLVLSDIMMKPISGLEVLKRIKSSHPEVPVIMLTGFVDDQIIENARRIGSSDFLIKPIRKRELLQSIYNVLSMQE
ncbi:MAG: response regulator [Spirochaetota bacterium]